MIGIPSIEILAAALADDLGIMRTYNRDDFADGDGGHSIDVRLRVYDGNWQLLTGCANHDQDYRGFFAFCYISLDCQNTHRIACDLIKQVRCQCMD